MSPQDLYAAVGRTHMAMMHARRMERASRCTEMDCDTPCRFYVHLLPEENCAACRSRDDWRRKRLEYQAKLADLRRTMYRKGLIGEDTP